MIRALYPPILHFPQRQWTRPVRTLVSYTSRTAILPSEQYPCFLKAVKRNLAAVDGTRKKVRMCGGHDSLMSKSSAGRMHSPWSFRQCDQRTPLDTNSFSAERDTEPRDRRHREFYLSIRELWMAELQPRPIPPVPELR